MTEKASIEDALDHLVASIDDARLSDAERRELTDLLSASDTPEEGLRRVRNRAFDLVRERLDEGLEAMSLLRWLERVARAVDVARNPQARPRTEVCFSPGDACLKLIRRQLRRAQASVRICVFTIADDRISDEIVAAHRRGVEVRILTDNDKRLDRGSDIGRFRKAGIAVAEDRSSAHMHHKFALIDRSWLLNGSFNWTRSASRANEENLVLTNDPAVVGPFAQRFEALWRRFSTRHR